MSTPPPYTNITGISRAIMKDNAQEPLASYNGSARPGELVVDLEVDPPSIYVGNSLGQLTLVSSGGEYGNSNVATYLPTYTGNVGLGNLVFSSSQVQTSAYAGGQGHMMMIDTNRTDTYVEIGSADKPFKTFTAAIAAAEASSATAFTFVLMGCTITENVDFSNKSFTQITIATSCRSVITGNIIITDIPSLSQLVIRNIEVGGTFTLTGDGTAEQMNNCSFYNTSFTGAVNITATNATAFYEVSFFSTVTLTNLSYLYINGAQFNADWTIRADDTGTYPIPSRGINPGTGGSISIVFGTIANNVLLVKGGAAAYVFQPHMSRMGRTTESYTIPAGWTVAAYSSVFRGTWTNSGSMGLRNSSTDNAVAGTLAAYSGTIGGNVVRTTATTVSGLPTAAAAGAGARAFVTDANSTTFNAAAASGGANAVPVFSNGTAWFIG